MSILLPDPHQSRRNERETSWLSDKSSLPAPSLVYWRTPRGAPSHTPSLPKGVGEKVARFFPKDVHSLSLTSALDCCSRLLRCGWDESQLWWAPFAMSKCGMKVCVGVLHHIYPHYNRRNDIRCGCFKFSYPGAPPHAHISVQQRGFFRSVD